MIVDVTSRLPQGEVGPMRRLITILHEGVSIDDLIGDCPVMRRPSVQVVAPVTDPTKVVAAPVNYRNHQTEMKADCCIDALGVFLKAPSSLVEHRGVIQLPYGDRRFDQEGEFAAVIGRTARHVPEADALNHVFGYTCLLDMTMRGGEDRSMRKSFDTFTPIGPTIVSRDEAPQIEDMQLRLWVNGVLRQRAAISELIWSLPRLIAYASSVMTLVPGDIVTTGTPEGVGRVYDGDQLSLEVTGLDRLDASVSTKGAMTCPTNGVRGGIPAAETFTAVTERIDREPQPSIPSVPNDIRG
ncbi:fumarylacetoacetate hydrolase family protein [Mycobacterium sp. SP-6446]|uniref:fumarylacetoacetate hydrolase family protein n=1 Tax=Mycobacterium sp. SP-6446 TaxID=1834162 RepID=UPI0009FADE45|nr:fumarylacetoacetate hydrolase family protein [Mycobacterium sp. SP-6446]